MAAPLLALSLWSKRFHILAIAGLALWLGCVGWSMASAVGFVLSSRGEVIAERVAEAATRHGWEAKVERAESQLATLGRHRPVDVIKAELVAAAVPLHIWRRSRQCHDLTLEESRLACAPVLGLRKELAAAEAAERLEAQLVAGRTQLATVSVAGSVADPQASAAGPAHRCRRRYGPQRHSHIVGGPHRGRFCAGFHARVCGDCTQPTTTVDAEARAGSGQHGASARRRSTSGRYGRRERRVQTGREAGIVGGVTAREVCNADCRWRCAGPIPPPPPSRHAPGSKARREANEQPPTHMDVLERWVQARLKVDATGRIPAREAYTDFCRWARAMGIEPVTETRFGRDFSTHIVSLGGAKVKRRDRAYYEGVSLTVHKIEISAPLRAAA